MKVGLVSRRSEVRNVHIERIPYSYPIYRKDYRERLRETTRALRQWRNLLLAGRTGQFWYNNMDHSIGKALSTARKLLGQNAKVAGADFGREEDEE
jgi:UDP-galactopyranose mutase